MRTHSLISLSLCLVLLASALASLFFAHPLSVLPTQLFLIALLFFGVTLVLEFANIRELFARRWHYLNPSRCLRAGLLVCITGLAVLSAVQSDRIFNISEEDLNRVSPKFLQLLKTHQAQLTLLASQSRDPQFFRLLSNFLESLKMQVPDLKVQTVDPVAQPSQAKQAPVLPALKVKIHSQTQFIGAERLYSASGGSNPVFYGEGAITAAIQGLLNPQTVAAYIPQAPQAFLDESPRGYAAMKFLMHEAGMRLQPTDSTAEFTESTAALKILVLSQPADPILEKWVQTTSDSVLVALEPGSHPLVSEKRIIDSRRRLKEDPFVAGPMAVKHPVTEALTRRSSPVFSGFGHLRLKNEDFRALETSPAAWLNTGERIQSFEPNLESKAVYRLLSGVKDRVYISDTDWLSNRFLPLPGNRILLQSILQYLSGRHDLIMASSRTLLSRRMELPKEEQYRFMALILFVLPFLSLSFAGVLYFQRLKS